MTDNTSAWKWLLAAACAAALLAIATRAWRQNRPLVQELRAHDSLTAGLLWDTLRIWSPLGLFIAALWLGARVLHHEGEQWLYRHTTLDQFCAAGPRLVVPCTGFAGTLPAGAVRPLGAPQDIALHLHRRYAATRRELLAEPAPALRALVDDPRRLADAVSPFTVLRVAPPLAPDALLLRLFERRQALLADPLRRTRRVVGELLPQLPMPREDAALAQVDAQIRAHLKLMQAREFAGLSRAQIPQAVAKNRLRIALRDSSRAPPALAADTGDEASLRRGLVRALADSEAGAQAALARAVAAPPEAEAAYALLQMRPNCTLAGAGQNEGWFDCAALREREGQALATLGFRESLRHSVARWSQLAAFGAHQRLDALDREAAAGTLGAHEAADRAAALVPASIDLGRQPCRPWHPANCVMNQFAATLETALADARNRAVAQAGALAGQGIDRSALGAQAQIDDARIAVDTEIAALRGSADAGLGRVFAWLDLLSILGWIALGFIVAKSLLYVLALELFHKDSTLAIAFDPPGCAEGRIEQGPMVVIDRNFPQALLTKKQMGNSNSALQWTAWPRAAPLARLLRRKYFFFNRGTYLASAAAEAPGMVATAESPLSVVAWHLVPGEEVVFEYRHFHGASENVTLHRELSLRLATLLLGRWVFHYARCEGDAPGLLLLKARVQALDQRHVTAVPRARLLAWSRHLRFKADSQRHPWRSLVNDFTLVRSLEPGRPPGLWVTAPEQAELGTFGRLLGFLKSVFSAMF